MQWLWVAFGGALGASCRYALSLYISKNIDSTFPWATWCINLLGCFFAGVFFACSQKYPFLANEARLLLMVGVLGGFTTFSSFGLETFLLLKSAQFSTAILYAFSSLLLGILVLALGFYLMEFSLK